MKKIIYFFRFNIARLQYWYAARLADKLHKKFGDRYYVMPDEKDKLIVFNRKVFRKYKLNGRISREAFVKDMVKECFYFTPNRAELDGINTEVKEAKKQMWFDYKLR